LSFASANNINSYSIIGHSQGGAVGTHILNYYSSGMDKTTGPYKVQSVGTPYQGNSAAGDAANLGKIFGISCGANNDLTTSGSQAWLSGISSATRKQVGFYTTTYEQGKPLGDYCNLAVNLLLQWPNDGTCELTYAPLSGGNNKGNTQKECHTNNMKYPAQYLDLGRNQQMNSDAAR